MHCEDWRYCAATIPPRCELKKGDIVRVKARMSFGNIDIKCQLVARRWKVFYWLKTLEPAGPIEAGEVIWGTLSDIAEKLEEAPEENDALD